MPSDAENNFRPGDVENVVLRKILARLGALGDQVAPMSETIQTATPAPAEDPEFVAAKSGAVDGKSAYLFHVIARRAGFNSTSVLQDVAEFLGVTTNAMPELTGAEDLELVSTSASDAPAGTGTRSVLVTYIGTDYLMATAAVATNGLTPVALPFKALMILWMETNEVGSNTVAVGNIIIRVVAGATHEQITAGGNRSLSSHFMVPDGYSAYIREWHVSAVGTATQDVRLRATVRTINRSLGTAYIFQDNTFAAAGTSSEGILPWLKFPARTRIKVSTLSSALPAPNRVDADYSVLLLRE